MRGSSDSLPPIAADSSIPARLHQVVQYGSGNLAVVDGRRSITYAELDAWSERIAQTIAGAVSDQPQPIALYFGQGIPVIAAMFGVLKAGHFYAVLDTAMPENRINAVLDNLHSGYLLTDEGSDLHFPGMQVVICPEQPARPLAAGIRSVPGANALAAIHYTSGATGQPKGVMVEHAMLLHRASQITEIEPVSPHDVVAGLFSPAYSSAAADIYGALLNGATLALYRPAQQSVGDLRDWLISSRVTMLHLHSGILRQLLDVLPEGFCFAQLRYVRPSGRTRVDEVQCLRHHLPPDAIVMHQLTSSETTTVSRLAIRSDTELTGEVLPVGYPIHPEQVTLVGADGQPIAGEGTGEVVVRSRYLARGYWQQPELTAQRFQVDLADPRYRIFRMGDLVRRRADGMFELLGRNDRQVKIRGYTVNLEAVEAALVRLPGVQEAAVATHVTPHVAILVAYICADAAVADRSSAALRRLLAQELPAYMLPARYVFLDALPYHSNGKVDRASLPPPGRARPDLGVSFVAPRSELEQQLADLWADLLELDEVGAEDNFFELGGDSILAMRMTLTVEQQVGCALPLEFLRNPTVANIASLLAEEPEVSPLPMKLEETATPLEPGQPDVRLRSLAKRLEDQLLELPLRMSYQEGMTWLRRWAGQPLVQRIRYASERRLFREFAASFESPLADDRRAFAEAILNSIWGRHIRQMGHGLSPAELVAALQGSRWPLWRDLGDQFATSLRAPTGTRPYDIVGERILRVAMLQGRGVILAAPHLPVLGVYKIILAGLGISPFAMTGKAFDQAGVALTTDALAPPRQVQRAHELLRARQLLAQGQAVYIPIDSAAGVGPRIFTPVGRRLFPFNIGAIELALTTGAPLLPVTTLLQPDNRLQLTVGAPFVTGDAQLEHAERVWITAQACGEFLAALWRVAPYARTWGDMRHYLAVSRSPDQVKPGSWVDFEKRPRMSSCDAA